MAGTGFSVAVMLPLVGGKGSQASTVWSAANIHLVTTHLRSSGSLFDYGVLAPSNPDHRELFGKGPVPNTGIYVRKGSNLPAK